MGRSGFDPVQRSDGLEQQSLALRSSDKLPTPKNRGVVTASRDSRPYLLATGKPYYTILPPLSMCPPIWVSLTTPGSSICIRIVQSCQVYPENVDVPRYYAVLKPMALHGVDRRARIMLTVAWVLSIIFSAPQIVLFHVEPHSKVSWYAQCVTFHSFPSKTQELTYLVFGMAMMYGIPLLVIIFTYVSILLEIYRRSRQTTTDTFRRSSLGYLGKAKVRTLKMTIIIVLVFIICWTPYYIMCVWYWSDIKSAKKVDQWIQKFLFLFASTNSCMNPIVYGAFNIRRRGATVSGTTTEGQVRDRLSTFSSTGADHRPSSSIRLVHFHSLQLIKTG
uniref:G-protein coupled receptors family 1 profile domain-containing protein n=1 Tax=Timema tahoe TaxID=61484 RepID=A0A7R9ICI7_9NEOP|nr:unnamed protein product [Timema tahoe]